MRRKPLYATIGSISSGTMRAEDLIPAFTYELGALLRKCRVDRNTRKQHVALVHEANECIPENEKSVDVLDELFEALEHYAPPYTYFGAHPGDGADYGFWPIVDDDEIPHLDADEDHRDHWGTGDVMLVNDHGNVECGYFDKHGGWHEYWSCV